jgi:hypothetical protein
MDLTSLLVAVCGEPVKTGCTTGELMMVGGIPLTPWKPARNADLCALTEERITICT